MAGPLRSPPRLEGVIGVTDDWPEIVPIKDAELRVMESHLAEELDESSSGREPDGRQKSELDRRCTCIA
jgi:hypothetical protein